MARPIDSSPSGASFDDHQPEVALGLLFR